VLSPAIIADPRPGAPPGALGSGETTGYEVSTAESSGGLAIYLTAGQSAGAALTFNRLERHALGPHTPPEASMSSSPENVCEQGELVCAYALDAVGEAERAAVAAHLRTCAACRRELASLRGLVERFAGWPTDVLRPRSSLQRRLAGRLSAERGVPDVRPPRGQSQSEWREVAPGISCSLLSTDERRHVVGMLVRLAPGAEYPPHVHESVEELHLLDGELWIDERKLHPGDYSRAERGTADRRVWSETGCTCVLITSTDDVLR
jgi:anti-sigma factor ChrR (cupin superfamily)